MKLSEKTWEDWQRAAEQIDRDIVATLGDHETFKRFVDICDENADWLNEHSGAPFYSFVVRSHVARTALGIRRHVKDNDDSHSLARLMNQIEKCASQLDRDRYLERFPLGDGPDWQTSAFSQLSADGRTVCQQVIGRHRAGLQRLSRGVEAYADRALAHLDKRGFSPPIRIGEIHTAVCQLRRTARIYLLFTTGIGKDLIPVPQYNIRSVFEHPFIKPPDQGVE